MDRSVKVGGYIPERDIFRTRRSSSSHRLKTKSKPRTRPNSNVRSRPSSSRTRSSYRRTKRGGRCSRVASY